MDDFEELMRLVQLGIGSRPFLILTPQLCKELALQATTAGIDTLDWNGGTLAGVEILCSDAQTLTARRSLMRPVLLSRSAISSCGLARTRRWKWIRHPRSRPLLRLLPLSFRCSRPTVACLLAERAFAVKAIRPNAYAH